MANIKSAEKRIRVTAKKSAANRSQKSELNSSIKKYRAAPSAEQLSHVTSLLDRAAQDNIIHKNKADRLKGTLSALPANKK
jgi:small subunit ribosomal protein S20